jgi:uncharacterized protein YpuA (DUF1002 family)
MRFSLAVVLLASSLTAGAAFAPVAPTKFAGAYSRSAVFSTVEDVAAETAAPVAASGAAALSGAEIASRLEKQLAKLASKDSTSPQLSKEVSEQTIVWSSVMFQIGVFSKYGS